MFVEHKEVGEVRELDATSNLLLRTADVIERHGWCQNRLLSPDGSLCLEGALNVAAGRHPNDLLCENDLVARAAARLRRALRVPALYEWNDEISRTKDEVVSRLRAVALGG